MHSPFPGMDPFLEAPSGWTGVHSRLINVISDDLGDRLAPQFIVTIEERVYIATPDDLMAVPAVVPDVFVNSAGRQELPTVGGAAITPPVLVEPLVEEEVHDRYLEIRDTRSRAVITTIEVLSPYNKAAGTRGREAFLRKRQAVLARGRTGSRSTCCGRASVRSRRVGGATTTPCCGASSRRTVCGMGVAAPRAAADNRRTAPPTGRGCTPGSAGYARERLPAGPLRRGLELPGAGTAAGACTRRCALGCGAAPGVAWLQRAEGLNNIA